MSTVDIKLGGKWEGQLGLLNIPIAGMSRALADEEKEFGIYLASAVC